MATPGELAGSTGRDLDARFGQFAWNQHASNNHNESSIKKSRPVNGAACLGALWANLLGCFSFFHSPYVLMIPTGCSRGAAVELGREGAAATAGSGKRGNVVVVTETRACYGGP